MRYYEGPEPSVQLAIDLSPHLIVHYLNPQIKLSIHNNYHGRYLFLYDLSTFLLSFVRTKPHEIQIKERASPMHVWSLSSQFGPAVLQSVALVRFDFQSNLIICEDYKDYQLQLSFIAIQFNWFAWLPGLQYKIAREMSNITNEELTSLVYMNPLSHEPTRYEMIRFSTWRIYLYQQFQSLREEQITTLRSNQSWIDKYPQLTATTEEREFYVDLLGEFKKEHTQREDLISHFICRMLYCYDNANHNKFIEMEKLILRIKLERRLTNDIKSRVRHMQLLKRILSFFMEVKVDQLYVSEEDWRIFGSKISHKKDDLPEEFAVVPLEFGEVGLRRRFCFVRRGNVYLTNSCATDLVINLYGAFLKEKLEKMRGPVMEMLNADTENQISAFIRKTLDTLNTTNFDDSAILNNQFKLNLKNVESLWKRFFPPCMMQLNQRLKQFNHLKHQGRRQLWLFLKGCGMEVNDNKEFFRKHFMSKVSASDLKGHMYNIEHAYGLVGKKQPERPKNCRNIITGPAPRKDQHHGCPFAHWRKEDLQDYLRKNYNISEPSLIEVMKEKQENHAQVACGRLFEGVAKSEGATLIPPEITNLLGKSPHEYFQAGMELVNHNSTKGTDKRAVVQTPNATPKALQF